MSSQLQRSSTHYKRPSISIGKSTFLDLYSNLELNVFFFVSPITRSTLPTFPFVLHLLNFCPTNYYNRPMFHGKCDFCCWLFKDYFWVQSVFLVLSIVMYLLLLNINGLSKSVKTQLFPIMKRLSGPPPSPQTPVRPFPCYLCFENYLAPMFFCNSNMTLTERWDNDWYRGPTNIPRSDAA